jgi:hypothetical protein
MGIAVPKRKLVHPKGAIPNSGFCIPYSVMGAKPYHYYEKKVAHRVDSEF